MQNGFPEPDPRLQKTNRAPEVATGFVDPCIFYLEATEPSRVPVIFICWARSSHEIRGSDGLFHLKLNEITLVKGNPLRGISGWNMRDGETRWRFSTVRSIREICLCKDNSGWTLKGAFGLDFFQFDSRHGCQSALKFIDRESDLRLQKLERNKNFSAKYAAVALRLGPTEWPTLANALASFKITSKTPAPKRVRLRETLGRAIYSLFKRKKKAVVV